jgi:hypothetical protein
VDVVVKPRWTSANFLLYLGAFTVWGASVGAYAYLSQEYGQAAFVAWTLLFLAVFFALATLLRQPERWIAAGLFAYLGVSAFAVTLSAAFDWWGWADDSSSDNPLAGWHWLVWLLLVIVLVVAIWALDRWKFPLLLPSILVIVWFLIVDVLSGGGSWAAVLTLLIGLVYFAIGTAVNRVYGFWVHVAAGAAVAGALLYWWRASTPGWWAMAVVSVIFIAIGIGVRRSSWTVIGAAGLLAAATYFSVKWTVGDFAFFEGPTDLWIPIVVFAVLGFLFVVLGLLASRRSDPLAE